MISDLLSPFKVLLLDMNSTFVFGEDRFGEDQDYAATCRDLGGGIPAEEVGAMVDGVIAYLDERYPDPAHREMFPAVDFALQALPETCHLSPARRDTIVDVIAEHECGFIPDEYADALKSLARRFRLGLVADIWAPKSRWLEVFRRCGVDSCFQTMWFSSDHGIVKPSPRGFEHCVETMGACPETTLVIGDSVRRDLGGAMAAGLSCVLVGGATDRRALGEAASLLELV